MDVTLPFRSRSRLENRVVITAGRDSSEYDIQRTDTELSRVSAAIASHDAVTRGESECFRSSTMCFEFTSFDLQGSSKNNAAIIEISNKIIKRIDSDGLLKSIGARLDLSEDATNSKA